MVVKVPEMGFLKHQMAIGPMSAGLQERQKLTNGGGDGGPLPTPTNLSCWATNYDDGRRRRSQPHVGKGVLIVTCLTCYPPRRKYSQILSSWDFDFFAPKIGNVNPPPSTRVWLCAHVCSQPMNGCCCCCCECSKTPIWRTCVPETIYRESPTKND